MSRKAKTIWLSCGGALLLLLLLGFLFAALPWLLAGSELPEGAALSLSTADGVQLDASWPAAERADGYLVEVFEPGAEEPLFSLECGAARCAIPGGGLGSTAEIRVTPLKHFRVLAKELARRGSGAIDVSVPLADLTVEGLEYEIDEDGQRLEIGFRATERQGLSYELRLLGAQGDESAVSRADGGQVSVSFGAGGGLPLPEYGAPDRFVLRSVLSGEGFTLTGAPSETITVEREALLGRTLELECENLSKNVCRFTWNETKGDGYEFQILRGGNWETLASVPRDGEREFVTPTLQSCAEYSFRVVTTGGDVPAGAEFAAQPAELSFFTEASPLYCTIWPMKDLELYSDAEGDEVLGTAHTAAAYCVLGVENGRFRVCVDGTYGYIDSDFCLINLAEYANELCSYDITNSYASKYMVHGYEIPEVTDTVVAGYEHVRLSGGQYLVPYLYPCCEKLLSAASAARADGYRLKIYDSYRPNMATRSIYDITEAILDEPLPETDFYGEVPEDLPETAEGEQLTYRRLVTDGTYTLANFLARSGSTHNMGIALDLTLEVPGGGELEMQTDMHDLSWYSVIYKNNSNAVLLDGYMKAAGYGGLTSEWWHFQDNETRDALGLDIYLYYGLSAEGWVADDTGWRYRRADGSFISGGSAEIGGAERSFDEEGYASRWEEGAAPSIALPAGE